MTRPARRLAGTGACASHTSNTSQCQDSVHVGVDEDRRGGCHAASQRCVPCGRDERGPIGALRGGRRHSIAQFAWAEQGRGGLDGPSSRPQLPKEGWCNDAFTISRLVSTETATCSDLRPLLCPPA